MTEDKIRSCGRDTQRNTKQLSENTDSLPPNEAGAISPFHSSGYRDLETELSKETQIGEGRFVFDPWD